VAPPQAGIAREIERLRELIARRALATTRPGETILINAGPMSPYLGKALESVHDVTIVTNSLDLLEQMTGRKDLKVILTSGEYHARYRCLVGPSVNALFETLRGDRVLLSVDGITSHFGRRLTGSPRISALPRPMSAWLWRRAALPIPHENALSSPTIR